MLYLMRSIFKILILTALIQNAVFSIGPQFLSIPQNTHELIIGVNPAQTQTSNKPILAFSYGNWLADIKVSSIYYQRPCLNGWGGLSFRYISLNDLELRNERPTDEPIDYFSSSAYTIDGMYAKMFKFGLLTTRFRYISIQLYDEYANGIAGDLSFRSDINKKLSIGCALLNIGVVTELYQEQPELPIRAIVGATYNFNIGQINNTLSVATEKSSLVNEIIFRLSESVNFKNFKFLIGSQIAKESISISSGINILLGKYKFGYAVQIGTQSLGIPQYLNFSVILP